VRIAVAGLFIRNHLPIATSSTLRAAGPVSLKNCVDRQPAT